MKTTIIESVCDFDGRKAGETNHFTFEGVAYEMELCDQHQRAMDRFRAELTEHARRVPATGHGRAAAVAAVAAAVVSLVTVGLAPFVQRQASVKWVRDLLPDVIVKFTGAAFQYEREVFETDWSKLTCEKQSKLGMGSEKREHSSTSSKHLLRRNYSK